MIRGNCIRIGGSNGENAFIQRTLTSVENNTVSGIGHFAFANCNTLIKVSFSSATVLEDAAFYNCHELNSVSIPNVRTINQRAFYGNSKLAELVLPSVTKIYGYTTFYGCSRLTAIYLSANTVCELLGYASNTFEGSPIGGDISVSGEDGYIYVPLSLYNDYISSSQWSALASKIVAYDFGG